MTPTKTMLAIPCMDTVPVGFMQSILYLDKPQGTSACFQANSLVYDSRNLISLQAIEQGFDRVLWLDSDMTFPPNTLTRLSADMDETGYDMITGVYVKRRFPFSPVLYSKLDAPQRNENGNLERTLVTLTDFPERAIFPVAGCGFGCVLMTTYLLKCVWDRFGPAFAPYTWAGEDISFCYRVNQIGATIYCDSRVRCGHIGQYVYTSKGHEEVTE